MKLTKIFLAFLVLVLTLVGCKNKNDEKDYANVQEKLINMETYETEANIKYISNKGENVYEAKLHAKKDGKYRIETNSPEEVKGSIIIFDGNMVWQYNPKLESKISVGMPDKAERKEISIFSFLENHLKSKDISVKTSKVDESIYTVLEAKIPEGNKFFDTEKLWLNNETKLPEKLIIYDKENKERVIVEYKNFNYNPKLEESLFTIENITSTKENKEPNKEPSKELNKEQLTNQINNENTKQPKEQNSTQTKNNEQNDLNDFNNSNNSNEKLNNE